MLFYFIWYTQFTYHMFNSRRTLVLLQENQLKQFLSLYFILMNFDPEFPTTRKDLYLYFSFS